MPIRTKIQKAVQANLLAADTSARKNVYRGRHINLTPGKHLPALLITMGNAQSEIQTIGTPRVLEHNAELIVQCLAKGSEDLDEQLEVMAAEVVAVVAMNFLDNLISDIELTSVSLDFEDTKGAQTLTFTVNYRTPENDITATL